jgi:hypothetical protein
MLFTVGLLIAAPAFAISTWEPRPPRDFVPAKGGDFTGGETPPAASDWPASPNYNGPSIGDEERAVFEIVDWDFDPTGGGDTPTEGRYMGLFYDLQIIALDWEDANTLGIYYGALDRNPLSVPTGEDDPAGSGGRFEIWKDTSLKAGIPNADHGRRGGALPASITSSTKTLFNPTGNEDGPWQWVEGGGPGGEDAYPGVNIDESGVGADAGISLWLQGQMLPQTFTLSSGTSITALKYEYLNFETDNDAGAGRLVGMDIEITGGSAAGFFDEDAMVGDSGVADLTFEGNLYFPVDENFDGVPDITTYEDSLPDYGNWQVSSEDPAKAKISSADWQADIRDASSLYTPEPATLSLLGIGLVSLAAGGYRRRKGA